MSLSRLGSSLDALETPDEFQAGRCPPLVLAVVDEDHVVRHLERLRELHRLMNGETTDAALHLGDIRLRDSERAASSTWVIPGSREGRGLSRPPPASRTARARVVSATSSAAEPSPLSGQLFRRRRGGRVFSGLDHNPMKVSAVTGFRPSGRSPERGPRPLDRVFGRGRFSGVSGKGGPTSGAILADLPTPARDQRRDGPTSIRQRS